MKDEQNRENVFRWQEWLLEGFQGLIQGVQAEQMPPEFWQHLGKALCELGMALQILGAPVHPSAEPHLLEEYERVMRKQGYKPTGEERPEGGKAHDT